VQGGPGFVAAGFEQGATGDGGAVHGGEVGVVGLVAGIDRLAVLLGDEGMKDAGLEVGGVEGVLDDAVIAAGAFDGHQAITEIVGRESLAYWGHGGVKVRAVVGDDGRRDKDAAVEVGEKELGASLGAVDADDAEVFGPDQRMRGWSTPRGLATVAAGRRAAGRWRERVVDMEPASRKGIGLIPFSQLALRTEFLFFIKTHIPGVRFLFPSLNKKNEPDPFRPLFAPQENEPDPLSPSEWAWVKSCWVKSCVLFSFPLGKEPRPIFLPHFPHEVLEIVDKFLSCSTTTIRRTTCS